MRADDLGVFAAVTRRMTGTFAFAATVWEHDGNAAWHFVSLPEDIADEIAERSAGRTRGFGSVRVEVTIGDSTWRTSLFPDGRRGTYVLPVKQAVRTAEGLAGGSSAGLLLRLLDIDGVDGHDGGRRDRGSS